MFGPNWALRSKNSKKKLMELLAFPYFAWGIQSKGWISGCKCLSYKVIPAINTVFEGD